MIERWLMEMVRVWMRGEVLEGEKKDNQLRKGRRLNIYTGQWSRLAM
jgi:hypothetical protein